MLIRELLEKEEKEHLSPYAQLSTNTRGRARPEEECPVRTCYQKDKDRILHSLSFRLLKYKTNVFLSTTGEKFRTRLTHTLEVSQIARTISRALRLNEDLTEAISLGHDLGHTPFGHIGEEILDRLAKRNHLKGFHHAEQSLRLVDLLEKNGQGLNLTYEVRDGILKHAKRRKMNYQIPEEFQGEPNQPITLEGEIVQFADWIAYINHDIDDAINMGLLKPEHLPREAIKILGNSHAQRIDTMVKSVIENSSPRTFAQDNNVARNLNSHERGTSSRAKVRGEGKIQMSPEVMKATVNLRNFLFQEVYTLPPIAGEEKGAREILSKLYEYYLKNFNLILKEMPWVKKVSAPGGNRERFAIDFLASLTDARAQELYTAVR